MTGPLPTEQRLSREEWDRRFKARIVERLTVAGSQWTMGMAVEAAECECEAQDEVWQDYEPEESADECLTYWDDDGE